MREGAQFRPAANAAAHGVGIATRVVVCLSVILALAALGLAWPQAGFVALMTLQLAFVVIAGWRFALVLASRSRPSATPSPPSWPRYTILVALHDEAEILPYLVERLAAIEYPQNRMEGFLLLEEHDVATQVAAREARLPSWLSVLVVPPGTPGTKPRALNYGLAHATGDLLTVYDAEDDPDPLQLQEAAGRFAAADPRLACLQAPLRIRRKHRGPASSGFLDRQFAAEYASLFEVVLPGMARLGLPFPLGGTSNHFKRDVLRAVGGWDSWNVTEDADLGFRLWRGGWRLDTLSRPTYETPPGPLYNWLPQRTRWLKGYMQTLAVHCGAPGLGWRGWMALTATLGIGVFAAAIHAHAAAALAAVFLLNLMSLRPPALDPVAALVLVSGAAAAWTSAWVGCRRIGLTYRVRDMATAPAYWALLSLAFAHALWRLLVEPHRWDKTPHRPDVPAADLYTPAAGLRTAAGREAA